MLYIVSDVPEEPKYLKDIDDPNDPVNKRGGRGRARLSRAFTIRLTNAFREIGPNFSQVAKAVKCDARTAKRGWEKGWDTYDCAPIKDTIAAEQEAARVQVHEEWLEKARVKQVEAVQPAVDTHVERAKMAQHAIEVRKQEANMLKFVRADTTTTLGSIATLLPGMRDWAVKANAMLMARGPKTPHEALKLMGDVAKVVDRLSSAADKVMAMERRLMGEPEAIVGHVMPDITMSDVEMHSRNMHKTLARARELGIIAPAPASQLQVILDSYDDSEHDAQADSLALDAVPPEPADELVDTGDAPEDTDDGDDDVAFGDVEYPEDTELQ